MGGRELLWYQAPPAIHAALLRGTTADEDGNISFEDEAFYADSLNQVRQSALQALSLHSKTSSRRSPLLCARHTVFETYGWASAMLCIRVWVGCREPTFTLHPVKDANLIWLRRPWPHTTPAAS